ncbi:hypothetical protein [Rhodococcus sp. NPDC058639]
MNVSANYFGAIIRFWWMVNFAGHHILPSVVIGFASLSLNASDLALSV